MLDVRRVCSILRVFCYPSRYPSGLDTRKVWAIALQSSRILRNVHRMAHAGNAISTQREALNLSQAELAELAGVNQGYLSQVESGQRTPSPRWERAVKQALADELARRVTA